MPKPTAPPREQLGVRLSPDALALLGALRAHYGELAGLQAPFSQSDAIERMIREAAKRASLKGGKK